MKKPLSLLAAGAAALLISSCAYDPYYTAESSYGYGGGYGGGYSGYSSSIFISTGDSRWGYDPSCHSYYDYSRRAYYDPFLYGYYPVGYRPPIVYGVPHPHGWRPGYCPPPGRVRDYHLSDYRNREGLYRRGNFSWSGQVRQRDQGGRIDPSRFDRRTGDRDGRESRDGNRFVQRPGGGNDGGRRPDFNGPGGSSGGSTRNFQRPPGSSSDVIRRDFNRPDSSRTRPDFNRPNSGNSSGGNFDRSRAIDRGGNPDRGTPPSRPQMPSRPQNDSRPKYSPTGANNPVAIRPERQAPDFRQRESSGGGSPQRESRPSGGGGDRPQRGAGDNGGGGRSSSSDGNHSGGGERGEGRRGR